MKYSQNNEEETILGLFKGATTPQRFMDIGAYDGKTFSNTLRLVELGWSGVCVEPSPSVFPALLKLHADNPNIELVNSAVGIERNWSDFYDSMGDAVSSMDVRHKNKWEAGSAVRFKKFHIMTISVDDLFARFGFDFQFLNLDVESLNAQLFNALPLDKMESLKVICVEHDGYAAKMAEMVQPLGFKLVAMNGENAILYR